MVIIKRPYKKAYLPVGDGCKLYYELYGNPNGKPVLFLNGGPGAGFLDEEKDFFNPKAYKVIFFDQRGAARSKPFGSIKNNNTKKLVKDITRILDYFKIKKALLVGGSWGTTLALVYAIKHPERVSGLILRGVFLANDASIADYTQGGVKKYEPKAWGRFIKQVPLAYRKDVLGYYFKQMHSKDKRIREKHLYEWAYYEFSISKLKISDKEVRKALKKYSYRSLSILEVYYLKNRCFLPENFILKNTNKLSRIPISIIHGKFDRVCPMRFMKPFCKKVKHAKVYFVNAGHSESEPEIKKKLISEIKRFEKIV